MTDETRTDTVEGSAPKLTTGEVTYSNPHTGRTFGQESGFERGPVVAAGDGERNAAPRAPPQRRGRGQGDEGSESV